MADQSLKNKTIKGVAWSGIDNVAHFGVSILVSIVLARLLTPDDYGLIGIIAIFTAVCTALIGGGFNNALIRKKNATDVDYSTVFIVNLCVSIFLYAVIFLSSPFIAEFFNRQELISLTRVSIGQMNDNFHLQLFRKVVGGIGVFAWLFLCEYVSDLFFGSVNDMKDRWKTQVCCVISYISYASMACYMFHRLFFWMGEQVWTPSETWAWLYMGGLVFPVMLVLSYYIQKGYDTMIKKIG